MMSKKEAKETVSMVEVLENDEELEEEASAVLGGSDHERCSYPQGYVKRQALYACNTCTPAHVEPAGICLACSYKCHDGHDLFELYTKRNFRCDCGNGRFSDLECTLYPEKQTLNSANNYSHNFFGLYCTCKRPYPDPEEQVEDEMIQCVVCEDWIHRRHLGCLLPDSEETREMVCEGCMNQHSFLWTYAAQLKELPAPGSAKEREAKTENSRVEGVKKKEACSEAKKGNRGVEVKKETLKRKNESRAVASTSLHIKEQSDQDDVPTSKRAHREVPCRLKELRLVGSETKSGAVFWPSAWRSKLCSCTSCQEMYSAAGVSFLLDESDTVLAYENKGRDDDQRGCDPLSGHDLLMAALDSLDRVQRLEMIHEYNDMKTELKDFLQRFVAEGNVVTPDDIRRFFEQQQSRKQRRSNAGQFHFS